MSLDSLHLSISSHDFFHSEKVNYPTLSVQTWTYAQDVLVGTTLVTLSSYLWVQKRSGQSSTFIFYPLVSRIGDKIQRYQSVSRDKRVGVHFNDD